MNPPSISNSSGGVLQVMMSKIKEIINFLPRLQVEGDGKTTYVEHTPTKTIIHVKSNPVQEVNETEDVEEKHFTPWSLVFKVEGEKGAYKCYATVKTLTLKSTEYTGKAWYSVNGGLHQFTENDVAGTDKPWIEIQHSDLFECYLVLKCSMKMNHSGSHWSADFTTELDVLNITDLNKLKADDDYIPITRNRTVTSVFVLGSIRSTTVNINNLETIDSVLSHITVVDYAASMPTLVIAGSLTSEELYD